MKTIITAFLVLCLALYAVRHPITTLTILTRAISQVITLADRTVKVVLESTDQQRTEKPNTDGFEVEP